MNIKGFNRFTLLAVFLGLGACTDRDAPPTGIEEPRDVQSLLTALGEPSEGDIVDEYIVVFEDHVGDPRADAEEIMAETSGTLLYVYTSALKGFAAEIPASEVNLLAQHVEITKVERNQVAAVVGQQSGATWGLDRVDQRALPLNNSFTWAPDGSGTHIYVVDTGVLDTHQEFGGRAVGVFDAFNDGNGTVDCHGHGTHVTGTVGGSTYGVAKNARLYAVRVMNCQGTGSIAGVVAGIDWVSANHQSPAVVNMSIGGAPSSAMDQAITNSVASGITFVVAAGNGNRDACGDSPARVPGAITVASTTDQDVRSGFSNWGSCVDLFAPGSNVVSAWSTSDNATGTLSGTSMASPHVAGAAALYLSSNPSATPSQVTSAILNNATSGVVSDPGSGTPNLFLYTGFLGGGGSPGGGPAPVPNLQVSCNGLSCAFDARNSSDNVAISHLYFQMGDGAGFRWDHTQVLNHTYASPGAYTVYMSIYDFDGNQDFLRLDVNVTAGGGGGNSAPVPDLQLSCSGLTCSFDGRNSSDDISISHLYFQMGDGNAFRWDHTQVLNHTYASAGNYDVYMYVYDFDGNVNFIRASATPGGGGGGGGSIPIPSLQFSCSGLACTFDARNSSDDKGISYAHFQMGDGTALRWDPTQLLNHSYGSPGTYAVYMYIYDFDGNLDYTRVDVTVSGSGSPFVPVPDVQVNCTGLSCTFDPRNSRDDQGLSHAYFQMGDGAAFRWDPTQVLSYSYSAAGTYRVYMSVYDLDGNQAAQRVDVNVIASGGAPPGGGAVPVPSLQASCSGLSCAFDARNSTDDKAISHVYFQMGDGAQFRWDPTQVLNYSYSAAGTYAVYMQVYDFDGNQAVARVDISALD